MPLNNIIIISFSDPDPYGFVSFRFQDPFHEIGQNTDPAINIQIHGKLKKKKLELKSQEKKI